MSDVDAAIVFLPRFTTLVGPGTFITQPLDVSRFGSAQFQIWRGPPAPIPDVDIFQAFFEESLDAQTWALGPATPVGYDPAEDDPSLVQPKLFSYGFRLRWFRLRIEIPNSYGSNGITCWAEGLLRDGGGGGPSSRVERRRAGGAGSSATGVDGMAAPADPSPSVRGDPGRFNPPRDPNEGYRWGK